MILRLVTEFLMSTPSADLSCTILQWNNSKIDVQKLHSVLKIDYRYWVRYRLGFISYNILIIIKINHLKSLCDNFLHLKATKKR